ncbi:MAG TPA: zinc ribbon domain-containing protein [Candidatus Marinimicrobia bacterium]|nr:zinc ribbon domain-containing protein [Candidatus Neomarinimicrobiota bacterium]
MPIIEFLCRNCGMRFEELVLNQDSEERVRCPGCGSKGNLKRLISSFSSIGKATVASETLPSCRTCYSKNCSTCKR